MLRKLAGVSLATEYELLKSTYCLETMSIVFLVHWLRKGGFLQLYIEASLIKSHSLHGALKSRARMCLIRGTLFKT